MYPNLQQQKSPKVLTEVLKWMETTLPDFGVGAIKARDLVGFSKSMLENANPGVRKGAIEILVVLRIQIGPSMFNLLFFLLSFASHPLNLLFVFFSFLDLKASTPS